MGSRLTEAQIKALRALSSTGKAFYGPRPGSNGWPLLRAPTPLGDVAGEEIDKLERLGVIAAEPRASGYSLSANIEGEEVRINLDWAWRITPAGRTALGQSEGGADGR